MVLRAGAKRWSSAPFGGSCRSGSRSRRRARSGDLRRGRRDPLGLQPRGGPDQPARRQAGRRRPGGSRRSTLSAGVDRPVCLRRPSPTTRRVVHRFLLGAVALGAVFVGTVRCSGECLPTALGRARLGSPLHRHDDRRIPCLRRLGAAPWPEGMAPGAVTFGCMVAKSACLAFLIIAVRGDDGPVGLFQRLFWATAYLWVLAASVAILLATRRRVAVSEFDAAKLQRKILRSSPTWQHAGYAFCSITDPGAVSNAGWRERSTATPGRSDPTRGGRRVR